MQHCFFIVFVLVFTVPGTFLTFGVSPRVTCYFALEFLIAILFVPLANAMTLLSGPKKEPNDIVAGLMFRKDRGLAGFVPSAAGWAPVLVLCAVLLFIDDAAAGDWHVTLPSETNAAMHPPGYPDCPSWTDQSPPKWQYDCKVAMSGADGQLSLPYNSNLPHTPRPTWTSIS
jgi:hypothetical protein